MKSLDLKSNLQIWISVTYLTGSWPVPSPLLSLFHTDLFNQSGHLQD